MPWQPGQSGNPKGRPKAKNTLANLLREIGEELAPVPRPAETEEPKPPEPAEPTGDARKPPRTKAQAMIAALWDMAILGDIRAIKLILAYAIGLPVPRELDVTDAQALKTYQAVSPDEWPDREPDRPAGDAP